jgi:hypothetical protein
MLQSFMTLVAELLRQMGTFCEKATIAFFDGVMDAALKYTNLSKSRIIAVDC